MPSLSDYVNKAIEKGYSRSEIIELFMKKGYSEKEIVSAFPREKKSIKVSRDKLENLGAFDKIKVLFSHPRGFFESVKEEGVGPSLILFSSVLAVAMLLSLFLSFAMMGAFGGLEGMSAVSIVMYAVMFVVGICLSFGYALISHGVLKVMGGTGSYADTYNAVAYGTIPGIIVSIVPLIGWLAGGIYAVVIMTLGFSEYHEVSKGKAVVAACILPAVLIVLFMLFLFLILSSFMRAF